jgi:hypothetical protein
LIEISAYPSVDEDKAKVDGFQVISLALGVLISLSLRSLSDLCVSAVNKRFKYTHRRNAKRAEAAQRT